MPELETHTTHFNDPFGSTSHRYFLTPELSQRLNLIRHLLQNSEQLLLVLAETGCGKTTLLTQLKKIAAQQCEHWWVYTLESSSALSPEALISTILAEFQVRQDGKSTQVLQESLRNHIAATRYSGQLPILLVDDAHMLPLATLRLIVELAMQGEALTRMRVALFCEPQITSILATPEFNIVHNTLIHSLDVPPFSKIQVRDYLQFRLQNSKYSHIHPFTSDVIKKIYADSEGIPGEVNLAAQHILRQFAEQRPYIPTLPAGWSHSKLLWGIPIIILLLVIAGFVYWHSSKPIAAPPSLPPAAIDNSPTIGQPAASLFDAVPTEPVFPESEFEIPSPNYQPESEIEVSSLPFESENEFLAESPSTEEPVTESPSIEEPIEPTTLPSGDDSLPTREDWLVQNQVKDENWLRRQNPNNYTLQVLGAHDQDTLKKFLAQHALTHVAMFKTTYRNKDWFVLVHGVYPNRAQARAALEKLPALLRQSTHPWARTLASVQQLIDQ